MAPYEEAKAERIEAEIEAEDVPSRAGRPSGTPYRPWGSAAVTRRAGARVRQHRRPRSAEDQAQELIEKIAASDTQHLSGTVKISTDLGLPDASGGRRAGSCSAGLAAGAPTRRGKSTADPRTSSWSWPPARTLSASPRTVPTSRSSRSLEKASEYSVIHNGDEVWAYDSASNEAYHATAPASERGKDRVSGKDQDCPGGRAGHSAAARRGGAEGGRRHDLRDRRRHRRRWPAGTPTSWSSSRRRPGRRSARSGSRSTRRPGRR